MGLHVGPDWQQTFVDHWTSCKWRSCDGSLVRFTDGGGQSKMGTTVVGSSILTAYPPTDAARVAGFFLVSCGYVTAVTWVSRCRDGRVSKRLVILTGTQTWANEVNNGNAEERALTISSMNGLFYATSE